jgi:hypothetical protein
MTDPRKAALLEKYTTTVEKSCRRTKNSAKHLHTRRMALAGISGDLSSYYAQELCTYLITRDDERAIIEELLNKSGLNN